MDIAWGLRERSDQKDHTMLIDRIEEICRIHNVKFSKLVQMAGLSGNAYTWKARKKEPSLDGIYRICESLGISIADFFSGYDCFALTDNQKEFIAAWRTASDRDKRMAVWMADFYLDGNRTKNKSR